MKWVVKVTETAGQHRITLPKEFCAEHKINKVDYLVIDDADPTQIKIGRLVHGGEEKRPDKDGRNGPDR
jgi:bifunctional DNA-binding transcriptional regulator/antitoxin component of YhaV-PrlF toxin-antitoxin module